MRLYLDRRTGKLGWRKVGKRQQDERDKRCSAHGSNPSRLKVPVTEYFKEDWADYGLSLPFRAVVGPAEFSDGQGVAFRLRERAGKEPTKKGRVKPKIHLRIEEVGLDGGWLLVRNKTELGWRVKTGNERASPCCPSWWRFCGG